MREHATIARAALRRHRWAPLLVAAAVLAPAAAAHAVPAIDQRTFKVEIQGVQTTTWTMRHESTDRCAPSTRGSGRERVVFRTRPVRMTARRYGRRYVLFGDVHTVGGNDVTARVTVSRSGRVDYSLAGGGAGCEDNGGPDRPPEPPDCGTRSGTLDVAIDYVNEPRHGFTLGNGRLRLRPADELFRNCPSLATTTSHPDLLTVQGRREIVAAIPPADLFRRAYGQQVVIARGIQRRSAGGTSSTTRIRWDVRLTAI